MEHKLKNPMVSNFKATNPQIAYLSLTSEAFIRNTSAVTITTEGQKLGKNTSVL